MTEKLLNDFGQDISSLTLIPSEGGVYEVTVNGDLVYSKKRTGRHAEYPEVRDAVKARL